MQVYNTGAVASEFCSILIYGLAGAGKTPILATLPKPLIVSSEPGLLSLRSARLDYVQARNYKEAMDVHKWIVGSNETRKYNSIGFDSISALAENILADNRKRSNDPRKFSPQTTAEVMEVITFYLSIGNKHVCMTSKATEIVDQITGSRTVEPFAAVPKLGPNLPYHFDNVFYLERWRNAETGQELTGLRCRENDFAKQTRNRIGNLDLWEEPDLGKVIRKIYGA